MHETSRHEAVKVKRQHMLPSSQIPQKCQSTLYNTKRVENPGNASKHGFGNIIVRGHRHKTAHRSEVSLPLAHPLSSLSSATHADSLPTLCLANASGGFGWP